MRNLHVISIALGLVLSGNFLWGPSVAFSEDSSLLEGTWVIVSGETQGEKLPAQLLENNEIQFADGKMIAKQFGKAINVFTYKQDTSTKPKSIDFEVIEGSESGKKQLGIYEFEEGQLKLCASPDGKVRPPAFRSEKGKDWVLLVLKRKE